MAGGFLSLTAFQAEGCGLPLAMLIKSALRAWLSMSYGMISILVISRCARLPPYPASPDFPLFRGKNKTPRNILSINISISISTVRWRHGALLSPPAAGGIDIYMMAPKAPYLPSGTVLHTSRGRSPQPVREASAGPGQNPWRPGPKARRRHQPSPAKAGVNLREYWKAPSRSRPRHR